MKNIDGIVEFYRSRSESLRRSLNSLSGMIEPSENLTALAHSIKYRIKEESHLRDKLVRKAEAAKKLGQKLEITKENLFSEINDLIGMRIIHLHTRQIGEIDKELKRILSEERWLILEGPEARTWDDEMRAYFKEVGISVKEGENLTMYTSVHYVVTPNENKPITCEIQVRTLMEEVWGEVDHLINYPHPTTSESCKQQIKVLARATSTCSRLVDSIFATHDTHVEGPLKAQPKAPAQKNRV